MQIIDVQLSQLYPARWNANRMDEAMLQRLEKSIRKYGLVQSLVIRALDGGDGYEVLSGNQRLDVLKSMGYTPVPCVVVEVDDAQARLLAQALNRVQGEDDLGLKAELVREVLAALPEEEILALLPETSESLYSLASLGQEAIADYLQNWRRAQEARLKHLQFQLTTAQLEVVQGALVRLGSLCDAHLRLSVKNVGERQVRVMEVSKVHNASQATGNVVSFEVEPGYGITIIPISIAKA